jgi:hypothetical protein
MPPNGRRPCLKGGLRQESSGREDEFNSKPFIETLRVIKPAQESLTSTWKRVLRGVR